MSKVEAIQRAHKFQTLDALRGTAALVVVIFHNSDLFGWSPQHGYLAVDMFFALSGFVLSYAYQARLDSGMPTMAFLKARVIRLAPLYLLALALGCLMVFITHKYISFHLSTYQYAEYAGLGLLLLPSRSAPNPFPYNNPSWTLFLELEMNVVHALLIRRLKTTVLGAICALAGLVLTWIYVSSHNLNAGWTWDSLFTVGIARMVFSYTAGMLVYRLWTWRKNLLKLPALLVFAITLVALVAPTPHEALVSWVMILFLFPVIVYVGATTEPGKGFQRVFGTLGGASYSIYVLHSPFVELGRWALNGTQLYGKASAWILLLALVAVSLLVDHVYDGPIRKRLRRASVSG